MGRIPAAALKLFQYQYLLRNTHSGLDSQILWSDLIADVGDWTGSLAYTGILPHLLPVPVRFWHTSKSRAKNLLG
jgi:hypothetical protein